MRATINAPLGYRCAPDGKTVKHYPEGEQVTGIVAEWAIADGAAVATYDPREDVKVEAVPETKARRGRGRPRNG